MPKVQLSPCEAVVITFAESDGEITVAYTDHAIRSLVGCDTERAMKTPEGISVHADLPDRCGREGIIYHEPFGNIMLDEDGKPPKPVQMVEPRAFSITKSRQLASNLSLLAARKLGDLANPDMLVEATDQLVAAAQLIDELIKGIENDGRKPTMALTLSGVLQALHSGKL